VAAIFVETVDLASVSNFLAQSLTTARHPQDAALFVWADAKDHAGKSRHLTPIGQIIRACIPSNTSDSGPFPHLSPVSLDVVIRG